MTSARQSGDNTCTSFREVVLGDISSGHTGDSISLREAVSAAMSSSLQVFPEVNLGIVHHLERLCPGTSLQVSLGRIFDMF